MNIELDKIDYNPHRNILAYPVTDEQRDILIASVEKTGFWENVLVRPHPTQPGRFQQAY